MSMVPWYFHKVDQCARLAKQATEPRKWASYKEEQRLWLLIAKKTERDEENDRLDSRGPATISERPTLLELETASAGRRANMDAFAKRGLELLLEALSAKA